MSLTEPDLWIPHIRLFSKPHVAGDKVYKLWTIRGLGSG